MELNVENIKSAQSKLERYADSVGARVVDAILRGAMDIESNAKMDAPVDTGYLRNSIHYQMDIGPSDVNATIGTNTVYAPWQEFGSARNKPHPYLIPAYNAIAPYVAEDLKEAAKYEG